MTGEKEKERAVADGSHHSVQVVDSISSQSDDDVTGCQRANLSREMEHRSSPVVLEVGVVSLQ